MRILFIAPYLPSLIRVRPYNILRLLARRHEVMLLATDSPRALVGLDGVGNCCRGVRLVPIRRAAAARSCGLAVLRGEPMQAAYCRSPELEHQLSELLGSRPFDLVHLEHLRAAHLGRLIPPKLPVVYDSVDCISLLLDRTLGGSHSLLQRLLAAAELARCRRYEGSLLRRFDRTVATTPEDARALEELAPGAEVAVVPNGVDLEYFRPLATTRERATLVFSGKMSYHANVTALLHFVRRIFPLIRRERPEARLVVAGSNPPPAVRALARDPAVSVTGYLPDLRQAVGRATVAVCPVTVKVGIQNKLLEAMAMGVPVVSTRMGAEGLEAETRRDLLVADDAEGFAEQVCRLLGDEALREEVGGNGRRYVETHHRWQTAASQIESIYREAIEARRGAWRG